MAVLLVALLAVFLLINGRWDGDGDAQSTGDGDTKYVVSTIDSASIKSISYTNGGKEYSFTLDGADWKYDADGKFPLDTKSVTELAEALSSVEAKKQLEGKPTDSAEYGLDIPAHTVKVTCKNGDVHTYKIGDYNRHSGLYYLSYDKSDKVYMVESSFASVFTLEEEDLMVLDTMDTIASDSVSKIVAEGAFGKITLDIGTKEGESTKVYTHTNAQGGVQELDADGAAKMISALSKISLTKCADYYAEDAELSEYGLDEGSRTKITVSYSVKVTTTDQSTGAQNTSTMNKTCVYYIGKAMVDAEPDESEDATDTSVESDESANPDSSKPEKVEKTFLLLEDSHMIFEVNLSAADAFFEAKAN